MITLHPRYKRRRVPGNIEGGEGWEVREGEALGRWVKGGGIRLSNGCKRREE